MWRRGKGSAMASVDWEKVVPEEEAFCEWCGHSYEFCTCIDDMKFEEEEDDEFVA
jgi:hypothetical protein